MLKKIVVPTDGSAHAAKAIDLAADLAQKYEAEIVILHVLLRHQSVFELQTLAKDLALDDDVIGKLDELCDASLNAAAAAYDGMITVPAPDDILQKIGEKICEKARLQAEAKTGHSVRSHVVDGAPADRILQAEEHENADMIVMGSRGLGRVADLFMGSVSHRVSHLCKSTCVTVK